MTEMTKIKPAPHSDAQAVAESSHDYFVRREAQERMLVDRATDPVARRVHAELARRYADLIGTLA